MGDPAGVGPEICLKLLLLPELLEICVPIILGNSATLNRTASELNSPEINRSLAGLHCIRILPDSHVQAGSILQRFPNLPDRPTLVDFVDDRIVEVQTGHVSGIAGDAAYRYIETAIEWSLNGVVDAVTTGPINKLALHAAGHEFPGHTEIFATRTGTTNYCMMQYSTELTCAFVTTHVGYSAVPQLLTTERILEVILLSAVALRNLKDRDPVIVVCGLNPHAGESGLFGNGEEERIIAPAIALARRQGVNVTGPFPPDTCFVPARRKSTDCFVCMYHDQGHIPLKALVFDQAVNMTLGLPIIRTSVDHGTAFDIAGKNLADPSSLIQAVKLAAKLASAKSTRATMIPEK